MVYLGNDSNTASKEDGEDGDDKDADRFQKDEGGEHSCHELMQNTALSWRNRYYENH